MLSIKYRPHDWLAVVEGQKSKIVYSIASNAGTGWREHLADGRPAVFETAVLRDTEIKRLRVAEVQGRLSHRSHESREADILAQVLSTAGEPTSASAEL